MNVDPLVIVGAGPGGLSLARHYPGECVVLERTREVGGLSRSVEIGGGMFDIGGHSFHTPHEAVRDFVRGLMDDNWSSQQRDARVWFDGQLIPYPFQMHFASLGDSPVVEECRAGVPQATENAGNFEEWIVARFGEGVARHFMLPYNRKLWARDLKRMSREWVGERVAAAEDKAQGGPPARKPLQPDSRIGYPMEGGFGAIFERMAEGVPIDFGCEVTEINPEARTVTSADGRERAWSRLASTMPVPLLLRAVRGTPPALIAAADRLETVALRVLMILVGDSLPGAPQRVYVSDPSIPPHKIAFNHTSSDALRRRPVHAIMCEIAHSETKPLSDEAEIEAATIGWLRESGLIPPHAAILRVVHCDVPYGYPVYTHERPAIMAAIRTYLEPLGIHTFGRFGGWDYANSDECIRQGMELARRLSPVQAQAETIA